MRGSQLGRTSDRRRGPAAAAVSALLAVLVAGVLLCAGPAAAALSSPVAALSLPVAALSSPVAAPFSPDTVQSEALVYAIAVVFAAVEQVAESDGRDLVILVLVVLVMRLFFTIQNWIDRQDPKLVAAPLTRDRYMEFRDPPPATGRRTPRRPPDDGEGAL